MPTCSVLVITYNNRKDIPLLLRDILTRAPPLDLPITVIDNASQDGTCRVIKSHFPSVHLIANAQNIGFGRAVNQGVALCRSDYIFLLNPDMRLTDPHFFGKMLAAIKASPLIAAVGPLQFKPAGRHLRLPWTWSFSSPRALALYVRHALGGTRTSPAPIRTEFLNAGCLVLRRSAFLQVGKFNEKYFLYGEEPDLFLKFKRHGFECRLLPGTWVTHHRDQSMRSLPRLAYARLKWDGLVNIIDALVNGYREVLAAGLRRWVREISEN